MADTTCTRKFSFDAAHRVLRHESKCRSLHGHTYIVEVTCSAKQLDHCQRVIDFSVIKSLVGAWIDDRLDHTTLINSEDEELLEFCESQSTISKHKLPYLFKGEPTAENIALHILERAQLLMDTNQHAITVEKVVVHETPNCRAEAYR